MSIKIALQHKTQYRFDKQVGIGPHVIRLRPAPHCRTPVSGYSLNVEPADHFINWQQDPFGNYLARLVFPEKAKSLNISVELIADMTVINPFDFFVDESAEKFPLEYEPQLKRDLMPYLEIDERGPLLLSCVQQVDRSPCRIVDFLVGLNQSLQMDIGYGIRMEAGVQSCEETLRLKTGSCRDSAWLLVQILRHLGLAARFVSGYLVQLVADQKALDGPDGPTADFTDLHAWAEVYIPGAGWIGLDPTSGLLAGEGHIPLACAPYPASAAPIAGTTDPCAVDFSFSNEVMRFHEDPRVTKPFSDEQWRRIMRFGNELDAELEAHDVRLTMGGEPTFVSTDDMQSPQWNTAALGKDKRRLANHLLKRLAGRFTTGGLLHYGQGKWYPGEQLPRWALSVFWRNDNVPLWGNPDLIAEEAKDYDYTVTDAEQFMCKLAAALKVDADNIQPGYEDTYYLLWREGRLPENVDIFDSKLEDPVERDRLRKLFQRGIDHKVGFALPLKCQQDSESSHTWLSTAWKFKGGRMLLQSGDSPMGLRLPLDSLHWTAPEDREPVPERDPFERRAPLAARSNKNLIPSGGAAMHTEESRQQTEDSRIIHSALCVEPRDGKLYVFLPPLTHLEHCIELISVIEATAEELQKPIVLEGYEPPRDPRLQKLQVTPDPGVIEVNVQPAKNWAELVANTEALYEDARQSRLSTEKFMLDGRHTGTGGGNHVTLGAAVAEDSPFLRRPDLLRSLITFWQHHPSLSYLFSGMFIGPTSQAPRVDEARDDNLYELELAFRQLPKTKPGMENDKPWLVDRVLRNFLVDLTGNTHRAEFCIDKLYSPDSATGRLGLLEFRNFEMPPHAHMSAAQMLLLRGLLTHFWQEPYKRKLIRWGCELHDRFMLPHYLWEDFKDVIEHLRTAGYPFELGWYEPFFEFRFPYYGKVNTGSFQLDLRGAIEPWHVLGEEATGQGTARYVDSSVERLQISFNNPLGDRYLISCNGVRVPLHATGKPGVSVAGIRYKAWAPFSALHPTLDTNTPLVFNIVDTRNRRAIGGCRYYVSHPGGRNYETFPVNANEAEARRAVRFQSFGHAQGELNVSEPTVNPEHIYTLDLRGAETD